MPREQQQFAKVLAIPRIASLVDPTTADGATGVMHDGAWLLELALDHRAIGCILDGTVRASAEHARQLEALAYRLPSVPTIAVALPTPDGGPPPLDAWMTRWPDPQELALGEPAVEIVYIDDARDPDNLTRLCAHDELHAVEAILVVTTSAGTLVTPAALAALRTRMPELRPIVMSTEPLGDELALALAVCDGAYVRLHAHPLGVSRTDVVWTDVELELAPGRDVELVVHAHEVERRGTTHHVPRPRSLHATDVIRIDAMTVHVDEPVFSVHLRAARTDLPLSCGVLHVARRATAGMPTDTHVRGAAEAMRIVAPTCEPLETTAPHDRWVDGVIVFDIAGQVQRTRLVPAMRITTPTSAIELRVVRGDVWIRACAGNVFYDGRRLERSPDQLVQPYRPVVIDDVRATIAVRAASPDEAPEVIIERDLLRYPRVLVIDDCAIELRRRDRNDELWCEGRPLTLAGTIAPLHDASVVEHVRPDEADLSWLLHAARTAPLVGRSHAVLEIAEQHGISARLVFDLDAGELKFAVYRAT
jgi:hypothetical protein